MYVRMFTCRCTHKCSKTAFFGDFTPPSIVRDERDVTSATVLFSFAILIFPAGFQGMFPVHHEKQPPKETKNNKNKIRFFSPLQRPARDIATCGHAMTPSQPSARQNWGKKKDISMHEAEGKKKKKKNPPTRPHFQRRSQQECFAAASHFPVNNAPLSDFTSPKILGLSRFFWLPFLALEMLLEHAAAPGVFAPAFAGAPGRARFRCCLLWMGRGSPMDLGKGEEK